MILMGRVVMALAKQALKGGAMDPETRRLLEEYIMQPKQNSQPDLRDTVADMLLDLGMPTNILGYGYCRYAIMLMVNDPSLAKGITTKLYPAVAEEFHTTAAKAERGIRHAVEVSWSRGNMDTLGNLFGYTVSDARGKPSNSEFITMLADRIRRGV